MEYFDYYAGGIDTRNKKAIAEKKGVSNGMAKKSYNHKALVKVGYAEDARKMQQEEAHKKMREEQEKLIEASMPIKKKPRNKKKTIEVGGRKVKMTERRRW